MGGRSMAAWHRFAAIVWLPVLLHVGLALPRTAAQQNNNFYFAQSQGRFVPSYENPRNGFFPSALQRQQPPPDSYQEQTLFVNSNNVDRGAGASDGAGSRGITPSYYQFTYTTPRSADIFEISPRPFSATPSSNAGFQYSRSPPRSDFFSNGLTASRSFPATNRQIAAGAPRKSPFSSASGAFPELSTTETSQRPPPPAPAPSSPAESAPSVRDRQLSYISNRARPFASEDQQQQQQQQQPPTRASTYLTASQQQRQQLPRSPSSAASGGTRNSFSSSRSKPTDTVPSGAGGRSQQAAQNGTSNGRFGSSGTQTSRTTARPNRYRSIPTTTTTTEAATERTTTVDSVAVRNRFSGRTPAPNPFRQTFEAKRVPAVNSAITTRGSFASQPSKSKAAGTTTTTTTPTTTTSTTTTTSKAPVLSRFIHQPAKPIIPSINITHNGSAKSAEVIYDYDDYEESKESTGFDGEKQQQISDFQPTPLAKNNSIVLTRALHDSKVPHGTVPTTNVGVPATAGTRDTTKSELEDPDGRLNNISENEYYDTVREPETAPGDSVGVEDHTVILTDNFYLPNGGSEETFEEEEEDEEPAGLQREINSTAELSGPERQQEKLYDDEYVYEDEDPITTTVRTVAVPPLVVPKELEEPADMLQFSDEDANDEELTGKLQTAGGTKETLPESTLGSTVTSTLRTESTTESSLSTTERVASSSEAEAATNATTESWVVVASVQTSRSVSGVRFLPFPQVEQDEKKQPPAELESKGSSESDDVDVTTASGISDESEGTTTIAPQEPVIAVTDEVDAVTTEKTLIAQSTESIIDKLDRVQSELSSGLFAGKFPVLKDPTAEDQKAASSSTAHPPVVIRKFQPNARATTTKKPRPGLTTTVKPTAPTDSLVKKIKFETIDDVSALLPPDYKAKAGFKLKKPNPTGETVSTTHDAPAEDTPKTELGNRFRSANISRSYKSNVPIQELSSLLPKDYKLNRTEEDIKHTNNLKELISKVKVSDKPNSAGPLDLLKKAQKVDISAFLPPGYKPTAGADAKSETSAATPKTVAVSVEDDVSKFLPPGYKSFKTTKKPTTSATPVTIKDDVSKLLPPGYKLPKESSVDATSPRPKVLFSDDVSKLLPAGYKPPAADDTKPEAEVVDPASLLKKIQFKDVSALLPPGFDASKPSEDSTGPVATGAAGVGGGFKVVFPSRPGAKKPLPGGAARATTAKPLHAEGPGVPEIHIRKGPPTRATTEFTGWPTPSTTPLSIEKLLEQQKQQELLEKLLAASSSSTTSTTTTTTTTTTSTTTPRPTEPGLCHTECDLAGTIRIVDGVTWVPELLDHNTAEWKKLAREVETELNEVYSKAKNLSKWYKKVRIDSFNKGSVLVDYFVELSDLTRDVNTLEIRKMFHEALVPVPETTTPTSTTTTAADEDYDGGEREEGEERVEKEKIVQRENLQAPVPRVKEVFQLGKFRVDPVYTDFTVIPKPIIATGPAIEDDLFLPQWAIAVIVIGLASLLFVILFGVTVLINRQKAAKKKAPTPLTADMLNELNKNHMGGIENFGSEDLYNLDDAWDDRMHDVKPKRFSNSMHGSSASNIYDSWRSQRHPENYFYDDYGLKGSHYPPSGHAHHRLHDPAFMMHEPPPPPVMAMYPPYHHAPPPPNSHHFSNSSRRYYRDYDPNF